MSARLHRPIVLLAASLSLVVAARVQPPPANAQPAPISDPFLINTYITGEQEFASVASDREGNFVVVWAREDQNISGQRFDASGSPLGEEFEVTEGLVGHGVPRVASHGDGHFVVVWADRDAELQSIFGQRFDASGGPLGSRFQVSTSTRHWQYLPAAATIDDDQFVVVWGNSRWQVLGRRFNAEGEPLAEEFQVNLFHPTPPNNRPAVASSDSVGFVVGWASHGPAESEYGVFGQRYDPAGNPLGDIFHVNTYTTGYQIDPEVATDVEGGFAATWYAPQHPDDSIIARLFDAQGNPATGELRASPSGADPAVSFVEDDFVLVWDAGSRGIAGRLFSSSGQAVGAEFEIGAGLGTWDDARLASTSEHQFVVVWDGGPGEDIWGQLFSIPALTLTVDGSCPGPVTVDVSSAPPNSEVALIAAANTNGFTKGGALCNGTQLEIGEPFQLPPRFVIVDGNGNGSASLTLGTNRCHLQALALQSCETSNVVEVP